MSAFSILLATRGATLGRRAILGCSCVSSTPAVPFLRMADHDGALIRAAPTGTTGGAIRTMAKKKSAGSASNNKDSAGRRLGIKIWANMTAKAGNILVRQRGEKFKAGLNVGMGRDHTLFARCEGILKMTKLPTNKKRNVVHIVPRDEMETFLELVAKIPKPPKKFARSHHIRKKPLTQKSLFWNNIKLGTKLTPDIPPVFDINK